MAEPARVIPAIEVEVEQALAICGGDPMKALRVTLIANAFLEARLDQLTAEASAGFSRGKVRKPAKKPKPDGGKPESSTPETNKPGSNAPEGTAS